jgi:hypothetical protein
MSEMSRLVCREIEYETRVGQPYANPVFRRLWIARNNQWPFQRSYRKASANLFVQLPLYPCRRELAGRSACWCGMDTLRFRTLGGSATRHTRLGAHATIMRVSEGSNGSRRSDLGCLGCKSWTKLYPVWSSSCFLVSLLPNIQLSINYAANISKGLSDVLTMTERSEEAAPRALATELFQHESVELFQHESVFVITT